MKRFVIYFPIFIVLLFPITSSASWSSTINLTSDYLFNGVSQTHKNPAVQMSIDWSDDSGFYAGAWGSNVDFGDDTKFEVDGYVGYQTLLKNVINVDIGAARYTYWGANYSSSGNYTEYYTKFGVDNTQISLWFTTNYFGLGAKHYVAMLEHTVTLSPTLSLWMEIDTSVSLDEDKWQWEPNDNRYIHGQIALLFDINNFNFSLALHKSDLDSYDTSSLVLSISKVFDF